MAIKVRKLNDDGDWLIGGKAVYIDDDNAILQNVKTRLKSLKYDYFLDSESNIDWFGILGQIKNQDTVINEIYRVTLATDGVVEVSSVEVVNLEKRNATIEVKLATINNENILLQLGILDG